MMARQAYMGARAGGGPRYIAAQTIAAEFRVQALEMEVRRLATDLVRLRASIREHITALSSDQSKTLARLRYLLAHGQDMQ